jgi:Fungal specific transcription factor domain
MPFRGKPSQSCETCRKRRTKVSQAVPIVYHCSQPQCDKREPSCGQCLNKDVQCPGYRNQLDLAFLDQTTTVVHKFQKPKEKSTEEKASKNHHAVVLASSPRSMDHPIHEIAFVHFLNSYAAESHFNYLLELHGSTRLATPLMASTYATALANLSRERQDASIMRAARIFYSQALQATNAALQSNEAKEDSTLASVLVLSLFETIALDGQLSTKSWDTHTEGAYSLLQLRGLDSLKTPIGQRLYIHVSSNIRVGCVQRAVSPPKKFLELDAQIVPYLEIKHPVIKFWPIADAFARLTMMDEHPSQYSPQEVMKLSLEVGNMSEAVANDLEPPWTYEYIKPRDAPIEAFEGRAHHYSSHAVARVLNTIRMTRLFANEMVWKHAMVMEANSPQNSQVWSDMRQTASENVLEMALEILATVPQFIRRPASDQTPLKAPVVSGFVWPLSAVGRSMLLPTKVRKYAIDALHIIGKEAKLSQATKIAQLIGKERVDLGW